VAGDGELLDGRRNFGAGIHRSTWPTALFEEECTALRGSPGLRLMAGGSYLSGMGCHAVKSRVEAAMAWIKGQERGGSEVRKDNPARPRDGFIVGGNRQEMEE
jgi:hypothetical protein